MNIGEELQAAVQRSAKLSTLISGLFESEKSAETEDVVLVGAAVADSTAHAPVPWAEAAPVAPDPADEMDRPAAGTDGAVVDADAESADVEGAPDADDSTAGEAALIEAAKEDPAAFGALYERYVDRVYAYIYHRVSNTQEAEDLTARTFYRALSRLHTYEDRGYPFSAWLFRIAHNLVANWHRDRSRRRFLSLDRIWSHSHEDDTPEHAVEQAERSNALWDAINRLPKDRRELIFYKFGSRLSNVEIGELMDKSESAIKSLYFRTLAALRSDLEKGDF